MIYIFQMFRNAAPEGALEFQNLQNRLPDAEPYLFNLADQLVDAAPQAEWNLLIGDDTSGRLPTYFIRQVLGESGYSVPTRFVVGSKTLHDELGLECYKKYFDQVVRDLGQTSTRALIVTEAISTGRTARFLASGLTPFVDSLDIATVANLSRKNFEPDFAGSHDFDAKLKVFYAFESTAYDSYVSRLMFLARHYIPTFIKDRTPDRLKAVGLQPANELLGLYVPEGADAPVARKKPGNHYSAQAYKLIQELVEKYITSRTAQREIPLQTSPAEPAKPLAAVK